MISVCCCAINSRWDVHSFVECLEYHNKGTDFEIVLTHDCRVEDGSTETFNELIKKYPNFKVVRHTKQDTIDYLSWLMVMYEIRQRFNGDFRNHLLSNLRKYAEGTLANETKEFLWLSSGILYNKAIMASKGDIIVVTPADFLYLFRLKDLENHINQNSVKGLFYGGLRAIWARISNAPIDWIKLKTEQGSRRGNTKTGPYDAPDVFRDFMRYPSMPNDLHLADCRRNEAINLGNSNFIDRMMSYTLECFQNPTDQLTTPNFHGFHAMTRKSYEMLGGFTEEFYGRAYADDKMTRRGDLCHRPFRIKPDLPTWASVAWIGQGEFCPSRLDYAPNITMEDLKRKDPYFDQHPSNMGVKHIQLHQGYVDNAYLNNLSKEHHEKFMHEPPTRFTAHDRF